MINKSVNSHSEIYYNIEIIASQNTLFLFIYQDVVVTDSEKQTILDVNAATSSKTSQDSTQEDKGCTLQTNEIKDDNILTEEDVEKNNWSSWTPKVLKTKMSNTLSANKENNPSTWLHRRRPKTSLQDKVLQSKLELIETMKRNTQTEAALKELILQEQLKQEKLKTEKLQLEVETLRKNLN
ncbi:uncharacterized protein LOC125075705 [Vanessa atalanta]|uniref:uncharacterized protein LOC125075705 n=1 Tax=Vanessa atalanta TaxID=42275 RepID=UPI001FCE1DDD|nr:uncharacterized protein LOC125075705 [Vanessa atalanta]